MGYARAQAGAAVRTDANFHPSNRRMSRKLNLQRIAVVSQQTSYRAVSYAVTTSFCEACEATVKLAVAHFAQVNRNGDVKVRGEKKCFAAISRELVRNFRAAGSP